MPCCPGKIGPRHPHHDHRRVHDGESRRRSITLNVSDCLEPFSAVAVVDEQPRQIEQPRHPRDDGNDVQRLDPEQHHALPYRELVPYGIQPHPRAAPRRCTVSHASSSAHQLHEPGHVLRRRLRHDAVAEIEDEGLAGKCCSEFRQRAVPSPSPPATSSSGSRLPCTTVRPERASAMNPSGMAVSQPTPSTPGLGGIARCLHARAPRKPDDGHIGMQRLEPCDHGFGRRHHPALELVVGEAPRPAVENLHDIGARSHLSGKVVDGNLDQQVDQPLKSIGVAVGPAPCVGLVGRALPAHHVGRHRPRRAAKSDEGSVMVEFLSDLGDRLENAAELGPSCRSGSSAQDRRALRMGSSRGPSPSTNSTFCPSASGTTQDVGEQNRRIETVAPDRLQRHLGRHLGRVAQVEKASGLGTQRAILGQIAASLAHQPDRRRRSRPRRQTP